MERDENDGFVKVSTEHDPSKSASKVLDFAKDMLKISKLVNMPHNSKPVTIRIGMHTGAVVSGVIGTKLPKFSVFGDTMNTASRMESTADHGGIHISADTFFLLQSAGNTDTWKGTGGIEVKGKGIMETFHIEMDEEDLDVNAIKAVYKNELHKSTEISNSHATLLYVGDPSAEKDFPAPTKKVPNPHAHPKGNLLS
eukprot:gene12809-16068_t